MTSRENAVQHLGVRELPRTGTRHAAGVIAGRWLFATGVNAAVASDGLTSAILESHPFDAPKAKREAVRLPGMPLPISIVQVPWLPVDDCSVLLDLWVYVPR